MRVEAHDMPPCPAQHGIACRRVPFHRAAKARVEVGLARGDKAEFQRGADLNHPQPRTLGEPGAGARLLMGFAEDRRQRLLRPATDPQSAAEARGRRLLLGAALTETIAFYSIMMTFVI